MFTNINAIIQASRVGRNKMFAIDGLSLDSYDIRVGKVIRIHQCAAMPIS